MTYCPYECVLLCSLSLPFTLLSLTMTQSRKSAQHLPFFQKKNMDYAEQSKIANRRLAMLAELQAKMDNNTITAEAYQEELVILLGGGNAPPAPVNMVVEQPALVAAMEKQLRYQEFPWAQYQDSHASTYRSLEAEAHKPGMQAILRDEVEQRARENDLSAMEVMALQYLLFYSEKDDPARNLLAIFILRTPLQTRFATHNWGAVAPSMLEADVKEHGLAMTQIEYPLFPGPKCRLLNEKVFRAHYAYMAQWSGGGMQRENEVPRFFRGERHEELQGGAEGRDAERERHLKREAELERKVAELERKLANAKKDPKKDAKPSAATTAPPPLRNPGHYRDTWRPLEGTDGSISSPKN